MGLYLLLWTLGCTLGFLAGTAVLYRRGVLGLRTLVALGVAWGGLLLGAKWHYRLEYLPPLEALWLGPRDVLDPGFRLPLGLFTGAVLAGLYCWASGAPWREVGDALAVAASVLIPIGRIGCMINHCCMGTVCGTWWQPFCLRLPMGTETYLGQLETGLISIGTPLSLPVHPLPVYFALASLATLGVLLWLLRRDAPPGSLLATFCVLRPLAKLGLEPLRASTGRNAGLMIAIPLGVLVTTVAVLVTGLVRRRLCADKNKPSRAITVAALLLAVLGMRGFASGAAASPDAWAAALEAYVRKPQANARRLFGLAHAGTADLPPVYVLALADAHLRRGQDGEAVRLFTQVLDQAPGPPWEGWANFGLGAVALKSGDQATARTYYARTASLGPDARLFAELTLALTDAGVGRVRDALPMLDRIAACAEGTPSLCTAAQMWSGYARFWVGDRAGAVQDFERARARDPHGPLVDDARYAAARARWEAGDAESGIAELRALASERGRRGRASPSPGLIGLERGAVLVGAYRRQLRLPLAPPGQQALEMLDGDGTALARAALRGGGPSAASASPAMWAPETGPIPSARPSVARAAAPASTAPAHEAAARDAGSARHRRLGAGMLLVVALATAWTLARRKGSQRRVR